MQKTQRIKKQQQQQLKLKLDIPIFREENGLTTSCEIRTTKVPIP